MPTLPGRRRPGFPGLPRFEFPPVRVERTEVKLAPGRLTAARDAVPAQ